jgi:sulfur carrier protein
MISLFLNGDIFETQSSILDDILIEWQLKNKHVCSIFAVAVNQNFVPQSHYAETQLYPGDKIEILIPMQGG